MDSVVYDYYITPTDFEEAAQNGISEQLLIQRVRLLGWSKRRAVEQPPHDKKRIDKKWIDTAFFNGICYSTLKYRINRLGWEPERAATQPLQNRQQQAKKAYESSRKYPKYYHDLAIRNGINERTFHRRMKSGWTAREAATRPPMTPTECGLMTKGKRSFQFKRQRKSKR
jgi:hypothetical protein